MGLDSHREGAINSSTIIVEETGEVFYIHSLFYESKTWTITKRIQIGFRRWARRFGRGWKEYKQAGVQKKRIEEGTILQRVMKKKKRNWIAQIRY